VSFHPSPLGLAPALSRVLACDRNSFPCINCARRYMNFLVALSDSTFSNQMRHWHLILTPSTPPPPEPISVLSRIEPQEACLASSTSSCRTWQRSPPCTIGEPPQRSGYIQFYLRVSGACSGLMLAAGVCCAWVLVEVSGVSATLEEQRPHSRCSSSHKKFSAGNWLEKLVIKSPCSEFYYRAVSS